MVVHFSNQVKIYVAPLAFSDSFNSFHELRERAFLDPTFEGGVLMLLQRRIWFLGVEKKNTIFFKCVGDGIPLSNFYNR